MDKDEFQIVSILIVTAVLIIVGLFCFGCSTGPTKPFVPPKTVMDFQGGMFIEVPYNDPFKR